MNITSEKDELFDDAYAEAREKPFTVKATMPGTSVVAIVEALYLVLDKMTATPEQKDAIRTGALVLIKATEQAIHEGRE